MSLVVDDEATPGSLEADLLAGNIRIGVDDHAAFDASISPQGCHGTLSGGTIVCGGEGSHSIALLKPLQRSRYLLVVFARRLDSSATGDIRPQPIVTVTLDRPAGELVDVISDCRPALSTGRDCADRGRPNIVFIVTDDQRWDTLPYMPHVMDELAAQGVSFTNAFVTTPLCAPSRATMLTGLYAHNHGVRTNARPDGGFPAFDGHDTSTLATWLHDAGYRTGMYGKFLTDYLRNCPPFTPYCTIPPGWDEWHVFFNQRYYNYKLAENMSYTSFGSAPEDYSTDVIASKAVEFIESSRGQPFFLHIGFHGPHSEGNQFPMPAPRHFGAFAGIAPWRPVSWDEADVSDKPPWVQVLPRANDILAGILTWGGLANGTRRYQLECLLAVDEAVDSIVQALERTGQTENTVIMFTSDNGYLWGEHRVFAAKEYPYDESLRIPLIVKYPRLVAQAREDAHLAANIDLAPTLADLADAPVASPVDGRSLAPLLRGESEWRSDFLIEYWNATGEGLPDYAGVRGERFKYVTYANVESTELYELDADPFELENLSGDASFDATRQGLQTRIDALRAPR